MEQREAKAELQHPAHPLLKRHRYVGGRINGHWPRHDPGFLARLLFLSPSRVAAARRVPDPPRAGMTEQARITVALNLFFPFRIADHEPARNARARAPPAWNAVTVALNLFFPFRVADHQSARNARARAPPAWNAVTVAPN
jgi:hypothetical protein